MPEIGLFPLKSPDAALSKDWERPMFATGKSVVGDGQDAIGRIAEESQRTPGEGGVAAE